MSYRQDIIRLIITPVLSFSVWFGALEYVQSQFASFCHFKTRHKVKPDPLIKLIDQIIFRQYPILD